MKPSQKYLIALVLTATFGVQIGCASNDDKPDDENAACYNDDECGNGLACIDGQCVTPPEGYVGSPFRGQWTLEGDRALYDADGELIQQTELGVLDVTITEYGPDGFRLEVADDDECDFIGYEADAADKLLVDERACRSSPFPSAGGQATVVGEQVTYNASEQSLYLKLRVRVEDGSSNVSFYEITGDGSRAQ